MKKFNYLAGIDCLGGGEYYAIRPEYTGYFEMYCPMSDIPIMRIGPSGRLNKGWNFKAINGGDESYCYEELTETDLLLLERGLVPLKDVHWINQFGVKFKIIPIDSDKAKIIKYWRHERFSRDKYINDIMVGFKQFGWKMI